MKYILNQVVDRGMIAIGSSITVLLCLTQVVLAGYQPPPEQKTPQGNSDSSGVRGEYHPPDGRMVQSDPKGRTHLNERLIGSRTNFDKNHAMIDI